MHKPQATRMTFQPSTNPAPIPQASFNGLRRQLASLHARFYAILFLLLFLIYFLANYLEVRAERHQIGPDGTRASLRSGPNKQNNEAEAAHPSTHPTSLTNPTR